MKTDVLLQGVKQALPEGELEKKLAKKKVLTVKLGFDPTAPDLHLGHAIVLRKLKDFQDAGHNIIFIIGDFTARIGDPTGKSKTRPPLSDEAIKENAATYFKQVGKILDVSKVTIRYNSEWLAPLTFSGVVELASKVTLARLIEREDFQKRISENTPVGFHELFYPLMQGYDSVMLKADVELGGTDQTFNLLMGRFLQEHYEQSPQMIITMPILEGLDGVQKMSKSLGNYIGLTEKAENAYGKLMSISDELMWRYFELLLRTPQDEINTLKTQIKSGELHPMELKKQMAFDVVSTFWSPREAEQGKASFEALFQKHDLSQAQSAELPAETENPISLLNLLKALNAIPSTSEGRRLIQAGAVSIDGEKITDFNKQISWKSDMVIKVGKHHFYKIK